MNNGRDPTNNRQGGEPTETKRRYQLGTTEQAPAKESNQKHMEA